MLRMLLAHEEVYSKCLNFLGHSMCTCTATPQVWFFALSLQILHSVGGTTDWHTLPTKDFLTVQKGNQHCGHTTISVNFASWI